jgi:hypothetical protein
VISPLNSQAPADNRPVDRIFLAESAMSKYCRFHETDQHSELGCAEFKRASNLFQAVIDESINPEEVKVTGYEIVPSPGYDQCLTFEEISFPPEFEAYEEHQGSFPPANGPISEVIDHNGYDGSEFSFPPLGDAVLVQGTGRNQTFQQPASNARFYQRNNKRNDGPFTSSIPPNNFNTPPHPNASNVPNPPRDAPEYRQGNHGNNNGQQGPQQSTRQSNQGTHGS